jgi:NADPH-dependent 2,4-dienoyl-CoA reductase/sulfur reductase-like enzyme
MSAAVTAAELGLRTRVIDEQVAPGGQIYRAITTASPEIARRLGQDYQRGSTLTDALAASSADVAIATTVWDVEADLNVATLAEGRAAQIRTRHLILATGAMERPVPVPGWTLPGVMFAGAAQLMLKTASSVPSGRVVLAGAGPLLLLVAQQLLEAGANVAAVVETTSTSDLARGARHLPRALGGFEYLAKGMAMMRAIRRSGVRWIRGVSGLSVLGTDRAEGLEVRSGSGVERFGADLVLLHAGVIPNTQLTRMMRLEHHWDEVQQSWRPRVDGWGRTSDARVSVAGDGAGIGGARVAEASGAIVALDAAFALGRLTEAERARRAEPLHAEVRRHLRVRPMLDAIYRVPAWLTCPPDETIVCRCEEVTAGEVRRMTALGCLGPNQTKAFSRCGMGPCQGRMCGPTVSAILAAENGLEMEEVGQYRIRPPVKPIPIGAIATLAPSSALPEPGETT